jgi:hypothetical protein
MEAIELHAGAVHTDLERNRGPREVRMYTNMPAGSRGLWLASVHPIKYGNGSWKTEFVIFEDGSYLLCRSAEVVRSYPLRTEDDAPPSSDEEQRRNE